MIHEPNDAEKMQSDQEPPRHEPAVNLPSAVLLLLVIMVAIHAWREFLSTEANYKLLVHTAFLPIRYLHPGALPGGYFSDYGSFVSYALLHADWMHLIMNAIWMMAFGAPVAWRLGAGRFLILSLLGAIFGALVHLLFHAGDQVPMIGASAVVSAHIAASIRFIYQAGGPLSGFQADGHERYFVPALPIVDLIKDGQVMFFIGIWFALNIFFGIGAVSLDGGGSTIAWQAHIGGFLAGLFFFPFLDLVPQARKS